MHLCITKRKNILENMYANFLIFHKYTIFYQHVYILIYVHTYINIHAYVYTCTWQQNTERLAESICQENSFKVYFKRNLKHFTCFITLWSIYIPEFFHKSIWSLNWPRDCTLKQTKKTPNKWKVIFTSNSFTPIIKLHKQESMKNVYISVLGSSFWKVIYSSEQRPLKRNNTLPSKAAH